MAHATLNLGIVAHVDAGKTTLTERLLYAAGVIDEIGSVDAGTTQTDSLELERRRGITIRSAVVSFLIDGVTVNLIDTPGHPDFIAEVERALSVLDGAVLVISAVEGVQPQTRVLMRALRRLRVPTLLFVNKIDRWGADPERVLAGVSRRLTAAVVPMGHVAGAGTPSARFTASSGDDPAFRTALTEVLTGQSDELLAAYVEDEAGVTDGKLREELRSQTKRALAHPVFFGSAITGAGVEALTAALVELLPTDAGDPDGRLCGRIFKIERGAAGEKIAYARLFSGTLRVRDRLGVGAGAGEKVTAISVFDAGAWVRRPALSAGGIGRLSGLGQVRIGDTFRAAAERPGGVAAGQPGGAGAGQRGEVAAGQPGPARFAPPTLSSVVVPRRPGDAAALRAALTQLAEQDPLIDVRSDETGREISVSLYGEVQKEVIQATLADDFGIAVDFEPTTTLCVERPVGSGEAVEVLNADGNPFHATVGLRVEPGPEDSGIEFRLRVDPRTVPLYVYRNVDTFTAFMEQYVRAALREGRSGWPVTDCVVTMFQSNYSSADGPPSTRGPLSTPTDFRLLTPMVIMQALEQAGTVVCEPTLRVALEIPAVTVGPVLAALSRLGAAAQTPSPHGELSTIDTLLPAARLNDLHRQLAGLTSGEGVLESRFGAYVPVRGDPPVRRRTTPDPLNRVEYLAWLRRPGQR